MENIQELILAAWERVWAGLRDRPEELAQRIGRRRRPVLVRPPRAWCLAVRASDRRIVEVGGGPRGGGGHVEHRVTLTADMLRALSEPLSLAVAQTADEAAARLGTTTVGLTSARQSGLLAARYVRGLEGRRGRPVPLLSCAQKLDPCARMLAAADDCWSWTAKFLTSRIPPALQATLTHVPRFVSHVRRDQYDENRHPELDGAPSPRQSQRLAPPPPDYVWYKWSRSGHYLGDDPSNWRNSPQDLGERPPKWRPRRNRKRRVKSTSGGSLHFRGYAWRCPNCGRTCGTIYLPLPPVNLLQRVQPRIAQVVDVLRAGGGFACHRCHRVRFISRCHVTKFWNELVGYLSGGLLYGHEVPRPRSLTPLRKNKYAARINAPPARRREQVMELLLAGLTARQMAAKLSIAEGTVVRHTKMLYAQHRVRGREALARKLGRAIPAAWETKLQKIRRRLEAGWTYERAAAELGTTRHEIAHYAAVLRRKGVRVAYQGKPRRPRRAEPVGAV